MVGLKGRVERKPGDTKRGWLWRRRDMETLIANSRIVRIENESGNQPDNKFFGRLALK
jgi:hypothetical protein